MQKKTFRRLFFVLMILKISIDIILPHFNGDRHSSFQQSISSSLAFNIKYIYILLSFSVIHCFVFFHPASAFLQDGLSQLWLMAYHYSISWKYFTIGTPIMSHILYQTVFEKGLSLYLLKFSIGSCCSSRLVPNQSPICSAFNP